MPIISDAPQPRTLRVVAPQRRAGRIALVGLCILFAICWLLAVVGISRDMRLPIDERWAGSAMLLLQGSIAFLWIREAYDGRRAMRFAAIVIPLAFAAEYIGVRAGFPFGRYHYTGALVPLMPGRVPAPITGAWLMIALGSLAAAHAYAPRANLRVVVPLSAVLATVLDACLEPTAYHIKGYWRWDQSGHYYGVPLVNFAGWLLTALVINALAAIVLWPGGAPSLPALTAIPPTLFWSTLLMFATIDLFRGYPVGAVIGGVLLLTAAPSFARAVHRQRGRLHGRTAPSIRRTPAGASTPNSRE